MMPPSPVIPAHAAMPLVEIVAGRGGRVILSVPHSGRRYSPEDLARSRLGQAALERLEDPLVDLLVQGAIDRGASAVIARAPRAMIDLNRSEEELDPSAIAGRRGEPPTERSRAGLGLIPTRLSGLGELWRAPLDEAEFTWRLNHIHRAYHAAIAGRIEDALDVHETVLLLDCHSMPPRRRGEANVVIGDRHGTTAALQLVAAAEDIARRRGFSVARNIPFAGGHVIALHGQPARGVHALQIEVDRLAYCDHDLRSPGPGFDRVARLFEELTEGLNEQLSRPVGEAAE
jgi:N-formylglutamate amidohydrolase